MLVDPIIKAMYKAAYIDDFLLVGLVVIAENGSEPARTEIQFRGSRVG